MRGTARVAELRTALTGVDPGFARLRLAGIGTASMALAGVVMAGVSALAGLPVTVVVFAAVLAMVSNLAVNETDEGRRRVTTALMVLPAAASVAVGALLAPHRIAADAVFVVVTVAAVYIRRFGPRGFALGFAAFMAYFFSQFLQAKPADLPWLLLAAAVGIGSSLLLRGWVFAERPELTLERQLRAFRARSHAVVGAVAELLDSLHDREDGRRVEAAVEEVRRRQARLNDTALMVADSVDRAAGPGPTAGTDERTLRVVDAELAAERLAVAARRLAGSDAPLVGHAHAALCAGIRALLAATATGTPPAMTGALLREARHAVADLTSNPDTAGRVQRVALAETRLSTALDALGRGPGHDTAPDGRAETPAEPEPATEASEAAAKDEEEKKKPEPAGLLLTTRQAVQVGVATSLAIVIGELVSPARWYWAVITAFIVFVGTSSRGDILSRGSQRIIGTIGGVLAGMALAALVADNEIATLVLLFACMFLALYLARVSQTSMAFWISAVLALLYGLIGQFSVETLLLRIEETAVGAVLGMLAGYLVLPTRTRDAFDETLDGLLDDVDAMLAAAADRVLGRAPEGSAAELARKVHDDLATLRARAAPLDSPLPWRRGRSSFHRTLRVLSAVDYYTRAFARLSDDLRAPDWTALDPAADRVRRNLDALRQTLVHRDGGEVRSAEELVDAAEAQATLMDEALRPDLFAATRLLRRTDQAVLGLAVDLGVPGAGDPAAGAATAELRESG